MSTNFFRKLFLLIIILVVVKSREKFLLQPPFSSELNLKRFSSIFFFLHHKIKSLIFSESDFEDKPLSSANFKNCSNSNGSINCDIMNNLYVNVCFIIYLIKKED